MLLNKDKSEGMSAFLILDKQDEVTSLLLLGGDAGGEAGGSLNRGPSDDVVDRFDDIVDHEFDDIEDVCWGCSIFSRVGNWKSCC